jgi:hypothetical protein
VTYEEAIRAMQIAIYDAEHGPGEYEAFAKMYNANGVRWPPKEVHAARAQAFAAAEAISLREMMEANLRLQSSLFAITFGIGDLPGVKDETIITLPVTVGQFRKARALATVQQPPASGQPLPVPDHSKSTASNDR